MARPGHLRTQRYKELSEPMELDEEVARSGAHCPHVRSDCDSALRGSVARVLFAECKPSCADTAKVALPLTVVSGARVFVTE